MSFCFISFQNKGRRSNAVGDVFFDILITSKTALALGLF